MERIGTSSERLAIGFGRVGWGSERGIWGWGRVKNGFRWRKRLACDCFIMQWVRARCSHQRGDVEGCFFVLK